jgi:acyl-coenzyme A synthetase/AMP-(fatty) acid ligase
VAPCEIGRVRIPTGKGPGSYFGNEAATKTFFRNGYFYPGDLAMMRADGRFALQGRSTDVINLQGQKIVPGPVEDHLRDLLDVKGVCLFSMQNNRGEEELHVVIESAKAIDDARLHAALKSALSAYPRAHIRVRYVPSFPRNHMGKIQRQEVRARVSASLVPS